MIGALAGFKHGGKINATTARAKCSAINSAIGALKSKTVQARQSDRRRRSPALAAAVAALQQ